ncbi:MAG: hypothetical protein Alpg2KO_29810 [Alphaproteobacteria bacterium]
MTYMPRPEQFSADVTRMFSRSADGLRAVSPLPRRLGAMPGDVRATEDYQNEILNQLTDALAEAEKLLQWQRNRMVQLEALAQTDELTGLLNRRGFMEALHHAAAVTRREPREGVLVLVDLDGFKRINDVWGHIAGDAALRVVAKALKAACRDMDIVARFGGDEFILYMPATGPAGAQPDIVSARIEAALFGLEMFWEGTRIPLGGSVGTAVMAPGMDPHDALQLADEELYTMKACRAA